MRKQFKKALSMVLSAAMVLTLGSGFEVKQAKAANTSYDLNLCDFGTGGTTTKIGEVSGNGEVSINYSGSFSVVEGNTCIAFRLDDTIVEALNGAKMTMSNVVIKTDGKAVSLKKNSYEISKSWDGHYQLEVLNTFSSPASYITTTEDTKVLDFTNSLELSFTLSGFPAAAPTEAPAQPTSESSTKAPDATDAPTTSGGAGNTSGSSTKAPDATDGPSQGPGATDGPSQGPVATETPVATEPFNAMIAFNAGDGKVQWWGDPDGEGTEGVVAYETEVAKEGEGQ